MPNLKTSEEEPAGPLSGAELLRAVQDGADVQTTAGAIAAMGSVAGQLAPIARDAAPRDQRLQA